MHARVAIPTAPSGAIPCPAASSACVTTEDRNYTRPNDSRVPQILLPALRRHASHLCAMAIGGLLLTGCTGGQQARGASVAFGGHPDAGKPIILRYKCGSCH